MRGDHRDDSDVDLRYVVPAKPTYDFVVWWTDQNNGDCASLRPMLSGPITCLEQHAPLRSEVERGTVVQATAMSSACAFHAVHD